MSRLSSDRNIQHQNSGSRIQPTQQQPQQINSQPSPHQNIRLQQQPQPSNSSNLSSNTIDNSNVESILRNVNSSNNIYFTSTPSSSLISANQSIIALNVTPTATNLSSHLSPVSPIAKKRLKLDCSGTGSALNSGGNSEDFAALKKRILEHKYLRLRSLKEKYGQNNLTQTTKFNIILTFRNADNVAELFFLQTNGNMMEYPVWRKKPPTQQFISFCKSYRLDQSLTDDIDPLKFVSNLKVMCAL